MKRTSIYVSTSFTGFHCWPQAPEQVAFLRVLHRHRFGVKVQVAVTHSDRDVEFFILQADVNEYVRNVLQPTLAKKQSMSCEMMAEAIIDGLTLKKYLVRSVEVNEDGENGALVEVA